MSSTSIPDPERVVKPGSAHLASLRSLPVSDPLDVIRKLETLRMGGRLYFTALLRTRCAGWRAAVGPIYVGQKLIALLPDAGRWIDVWGSAMQYYITGKVGAAMCGLAGHC